jgi:hypothetical protein
LGCIFLCSHPQVVVGLQVHPELRWSAKSLGQLAGGFRRDPLYAANDLIDA